MSMKPNGKSGPNTKLKNMDDIDIELQHRIKRAGIKARFQGAGLIVAAVFLFTMGYFSNSPGQREFTKSMNSRKTMIDPIVENVAPLKAG